MSHKSTSQTGGGSGGSFCTSSVGGGGGGGGSGRGGGGGRGGARAEEVLMGGGGPEGAEDTLLALQGCLNPRFQPLSFRCLFSSLQDTIRLQINIYRVARGVCPETDTACSCSISKSDKAL